MSDGDLNEIHLKLNQYQDARLQVFESELSSLLTKAQDATVARLLSLLDLDGGEILQTPKNLRIMRRLGDIFTETTDRLGYSRLVNAFVNSFPDQLPSVKDTLEALTRQATKTKFPPFTFSSSDMDVLNAVAGASRQSLEDVVANEAAKTASKVMFGAGAMPFKNMVEVIHGGLDTTLPRAKTLADTSQSGFYRVALDRQYQKIERGTALSLRYRYSGPIDKRERPFCAHMSAQTLAGKTWTKDEINAMENGIAQPKPVFTFAGGFNCRHQIVPDFSELLADKAA